MSEFVGISQPFSHTGNQKDPSLTTLEAIARSSMRPSFLSVLMGRTLGFLIQVLTGSSENFVSYFPCVGNENIRIAGGSLAPILGKWKKFSFEGPPLHNVLHVPKISYNLLSISKITHELNCRATFLLDFVSFQNLSSERMIGSALHNRGHYILDDDAFSSSTSRTSCFFLSLLLLKKTYVVVFPFEPPKF